MGSRKRLRVAKEAFKTIHGNVFGTPQWFFDALNAEFNFAYDLACNKENMKCEQGLIDGEVDSLQVPWHTLAPGRWLWCNPPYSPVVPWIKKAREEFSLGAKIVMLVPAVISARHIAAVPPAEIRYILGRLSFLLGSKEMKSNMQDSMLLIYGPPAQSKITYIERDIMKGLKSGRDTNG